MELSSGRCARWRTEYVFYHTFDRGLQHGAIVEFPPSILGRQLLTSRFQISILLKTIQDTSNSAIHGNEVKGIVDGRGE
jgi:hypothetical protein